jgi:hypothetical protein
VGFKRSDLKGVESMGKAKWILVCGVVIAALSASAVAGQGSDAQVFLSSHETTAFSAVLMSLAISSNGGVDGDTAISVSNTTAVPDVAPFMNFPMAGMDGTGEVWLFCYSQDGTSWAFNSSTDMNADTMAPVGGGLDGMGELAPGGTFTVFLSEVIRAVTGGQDLDFIGYCYVVGHFDALTGTYVNLLPLLGTQQDFTMISDFMGVPVLMLEP